MSNNISGVTQPPPRPVPEALAPARSGAPAKEAAAVHAAVPSRQAQPSQAQRRADAEASREELKRAVERMNQQAIKDGRKLNFSMDEVTDQMVITVRKAETGEVIRQIPSEAALRVAHNMEELKGLLHNQTT
ncbi:MAG: flagellar protein FlaG [Betaproteobacteria bacterium]